MILNYALIKKRPVGFLKLLSFSVLLSSCSLSLKTASVDYDYIGKQGFVMAKPIVADIDIENRKISGTATVKNTDYKNNVNAAMDAAKKLAVADAVQKGDADIILQPIYETESKLKSTTASVTGFAAKYKTFRDITPSDTTAFNTHADMQNTSLVLNMTTPSEISVTKKKKGKGGKIVLGSVGLLLLIFLIGQG